MQILSAIYVLLPQTAAAKKATVVCGLASPQEAFWCGRRMVMTIRAGLDCYA
jgi:hypothetical protein